MSGLTTGLASIDRLSLEIEAKSSMKTKKAATKIFAIIDQYHWMLVTLLLCNTLAMESLPIALSNCKIPTAICLLISVTAVLAFGEVIP